MDLGLAERVYVVTGGTKGLGLATARCLVDDGARVVVSSRSPDSVDAAVAALGSENAVGLAADNADSATPHRLVTTALSTYGRLDGALISVGGPPGTAALGASDEQWQAAFESVFLGAVRMARALVPHLDAGAAIGLVLSTSAKSPIGGLAISNGLRPGLGMLVKQLADELGPTGVRVNGLLPGRFDTDRVRELDALAPDPAAARARNEEAIPLRRYGEPEELGRVAAFLLSPAASYVTGSLVAVDGGRMRAL